VAEGTLDYRNLAGMLGCSLPIYAIPFVGGIFGLGLGMAGIINGRRDVRETLRHLGEQATTPLASLRTGALARIRGTVASDKTVRAPISASDAVLVQARVVRTTSNVGDQSEVWRIVRAEPFEVRCDGGTARIEASQTHLLTRHSERHEWEGTPTDEVAAVMGDAAGQLRTTYTEKGVEREHRFEYVESWIAVGEEITVTGRVDDAEQTQLAGEGYRQGKPVFQVAIDAELVTNVSDRHLLVRLRKHKTMYAGGVISLMLAMANVVGFGFWFFG
jgi:hypothetical protein